MEKHLVYYGSGESRENPGVGVDFMKADVDGIELYAEMPPVEGDETGTYDALKAEILAQAQAHGIDVSCLVFWND